MSTFLNAMNAKPPAVNEAILCLDPTGRDREAWSVRGSDLAIKLKNVMDKIEEVVLSEIPDTPEGMPYVWHTSDTGNIVIGRIEVEPAADDDWEFTPQKGEWRFTSKTLDRIDDLFTEFEDRQIVDALQEAGVTEELPLRLRLQRQFPEWMRAKFLYLHVWQWMALVVLLPLGWLIQIIATESAALVLRVWLRRRKITIERKARRRVVSSVGTLVMIVCWFYAVQQFELPEALLAVLLKAAKLILGVSIVWVGYRCVDIIGGHIAADKDVRLTHFDDVLIPLLRTILRFFIIIVAVLLVFDMLGYKPMTVLGVLGIGGIALAFAAQDTLGNFFGSITVLFDRPFGIGDWIVMGDVDGTVERVGFRSTRVRTFYNSVITIPNSKMVNTQVDNYGARRFRRAKIMLSVTYSTPPEKIEAFCEGIRELVRLHPYTRKDYYHVYFNKFAASSLDILLYIFFEAPDWSTELRERHYFFLDILRLAKRLGVEFAFPTQTVWLEREAEGAAAQKEPIRIPVSAEADAVGAEEAAKVYEEVYGRTPVLRGPVVIDGKPRLKKAHDDTADDN
jgi:MscS family membrane protein